MPFSSDITLPIGQRPIWPSRCILCGSDTPDATFSFRAGRIGWHQLITLHPAIGSRPLVNAPACSSCRRVLRRGRVLREWCSWLVVLPVAIVIIWALHQAGLFSGSFRPYRRWIAAAIILLSLIPYLLVEILHPPRIDATARGKKLDYEFADPDYAILFSSLNRPTGV